MLLAISAMPSHVQSRRRDDTWLDQIEVWFGILSHGFVESSSLKTVAESEESVRHFVGQHNPLFAHLIKRNATTRAA